jgi:hypothetical protein
MSCAGRPPALAAHEPVCLGYVNWCPADLASRTAGVAQLLVDAWVLPLHTQAARVAYGSIDLAICWVRAEDLVTYGLEAQLLGADRLYAVARATDTSPVRARDTAVLVDADEPAGCRGTYTQRSSWPTQCATRMPNDDGGITGPAFFDHVRRLRRPLVNSPKGQTTPIPPDLVQRPIVAPAPYWTWSLVWRRTESQSAVLAALRRRPPIGAISPSIAASRGCRATTRTGRARASDRSAVPVPTCRESAAGVR